MEGKQPEVGLLPWCFTREKKHPLSAAGKRRRGSRVISNVGLRRSEGRNQRQHHENAIDYLRWTLLLSCMMLCNHLLHFPSSLTQKLTHKKL